MDEKLTWKDHIDFVYRKISMCIAIMLKLKFMVCKDTLKSLYFTLAYPYSTVIWNELQSSININCSLLIVFIQKTIEIDISKMLNSE